MPRTLEHGICNVIFIIMVFLSMWSTTIRAGPVTTSAKDIEANGVHFQMGPPKGFTEALLNSNTYYEAFNDPQDNRTLEELHRLFKRATVIQQRPVPDSDGCWKTTYGRGMGQVPSSCGANLERSGALCYPVCSDPSAKHGIGPVCWGTDPTTHILKGVGRGVGTVLQCSQEQQTDAGLCYPKCSEDHIGVGPLCWSKCPEEYPFDCGGTLCVTSKSACTSDVLGLVINGGLFFSGLTTLTIGAIASGLLGTGSVLTGSINVGISLLDIIQKLVAWKPCLASNDTTNHTQGQVLSTAGFPVSTEELNLTITSQWNTGSFVCRPA